MINAFTRKALYFNAKGMGNAEQDSNYSLVIIDDEEVIRNGISRFGNWESLGFSVRATFEDGKEALEYLLENNIDAILTDIRMVEVSGLDLVERLSELKPGIYVVIMSGYQEFEYARRALQSRVYDYLLKPIEMETLYQTFSSLHTQIREDRKSMISRISPQVEQCGPTGDKGNYTRTIIEKTKIFVEEHYNEDISLKEVSQNVGLSSVYFCRLYKDLTGINFLNQLTNLRMKKAEELLKSRKYKIYEISKLVGYGNAKYFSRVFKRYTGITPSEYLHRDLQNR